MFNKMSKRMNCSECSHKSICKYKENYTKFEENLKIAIDKNSIDIFRVDLICNEFNQDKGTVR